MQIYKKLHLGPCTKICGVRALKRVIQHTRETDTQKEHSCIQHLFTLYCDFSQTSLWKYQSRDTGIQTQLFRTWSSVCLHCSPCSWSRACP